MESAKATDASSTSPKCFAFVFGMASGHINPSLPVARGLVKLGHRVHYLCREQMREAIEDTGAMFHSEIENEPEVYSGRTPSIFGAIDDIQKEYGMEDESMIVAGAMLHEVIAEMMLPGLVRWLRRIGADAVVYCPLLNMEAALAGKYLGIPRVALLTTAGPGSLVAAFKSMLEMAGHTPASILAKRRSYAPVQESIDRLNSKYGLSLNITSSMEPMGKMLGVVDSTVTLVTTCEALQDPVTPELAQAYEEARVRFVAVGPLLDAQGARRAAGHKFHVEEGQEGSHQPEGEAERVDPVELLKQARAAGRKVILLSMGTVITGDSPEYGWASRPTGRDGLPRGLTGRELCQAAWGGAFDAFGSESSEDGPLLLLALGPQRNALGELKAPPNAVCLPVMPQVDVLKAGVDLFLTHGGQNSFTEALSAGVPLVVCPGFADQPVNARKAVDLGVGLQVERPVPEDGQEAAAAAAYRQEVAAAMREVFAAGRFRDAAARCAEQLRIAGGVPRALELVLEAAASAEDKASELTSTKAVVLGGAGDTKAHIAGA